MKKAKKQSKKQSKKSPKRPKQSNKHEIVLRVENTLAAIPTTQDLAEPLKDGKKLTIPRTWMSDAQIIRMVQKTPPQYVYKRPAKGGGSWDYVTVSYIQRVLDYVFGWNWDFEIVEHGKEADHVWVLGKLTVRSADGKYSIVKTQFGRSDVKQKKSGGNLDYGNDLKGASSDALKKCASMLGIARDIYGKTEYRQESGKSPQDDSPAQATSQSQELKKGQIVGPDGMPTYVCVKDDILITDAEYEFSMKMFKKALCRDCQNKIK